MMFVWQHHYNFLISGGKNGTFNAEGKFVADPVG
jgi:hypothetical protein